MATQSIAVETMVVSELQDLFEAEYALERMYNGLRQGSLENRATGDFLHRLSALDMKAKRLEKMLEELDLLEQVNVRTAVC